MDWDQLFDRYGARLLLYARQWTGCRADAEEAVQDGFLRIWRSKYRDAEDPVPVLYAAVKRSALDLERRRHRRDARERRASAEADEGFGWFETTLDEAADQARLETALKALPPEQREVLVMKTWGEMTFEQIAKSLGISPNTAASRYRYALKALRTILGTARE